MIASRSGAMKLPRVKWRRDARRSLKVLLKFLQTRTGDLKSREKEILEAVESLRYAPLRCPVVDIKDGLTFRRMIVSDRFYVYYVYTAPRGVSSGGTLSIRSVKHAATQNPFLGVREAPANDQPLGALTTRDIQVPATA